MLNCIIVNKNEFENIVNNSKFRKETLTQYRNYKKNNRYYKIEDILKIVPESKNRFFCGFYEYIPEHTNVRRNITSISSGGFNGISRSTTYFEDYYHIEYVCYKQLESINQSCLCFDYEIPQYEHLKYSYPYIHNNPSKISVKILQKFKNVYITVPENIYKELDRLKVPYISERGIQKSIDRQIQAEYIVVYIP